MENQAVPTVKHIQVMSIRIQHTSVPKWRKQMSKLRRALKKYHNSLKKLTVKQVVSGNLYANVTAAKTPNGSNVMNQLRKRFDCRRVDIDYITCPFDWSFSRRLNKFHHLSLADHAYIFRPLNLTPIAHTAEHRPWSDAQTRREIYND